MRKQGLTILDRVERNAKVTTNGVVSREQGELTRKWLFGEITDAEYKESKKTTVQLKTSIFPELPSLTYEPLTVDLTVKSAKTKRGTTEKSVGFKKSTFSNSFSDAEKLTRGLTVDLGYNYNAVDGKKICKCCNVTQSVEEFYANSNLADGLDSTCKVCQKNRKNYAKTQNIVLRALDIEESIKKVCTGCGELKLVTEFKQNLTAYRGTASKCCNCSK